MAAKRQGAPGPYVALCEWIDANGGTIRLGRTGKYFTLVVEAPPAARPQRVAGYAFTDIAELDRHALLILNWLSQHPHPRLGGDAAGRTS
jgi:hypothetical protein